jgi:hypothetical protein
MYTKQTLTKHKHEHNLHNGLAFVFELRNKKSGWYGSLCTLHVTHIVSFQDLPRVQFLCLSHRLFGVWT